MVRGVRRPLTFLMLLVTLWVGGCQTNPVTSWERIAVQGTLRQFRTAMNERSFDKIEPLLDPNLRIAGMPAGLSIDGLKAGMPSVSQRINEVQIISLKRSADGLKADVALWVPGGAMETTMEFSPEGKIRSISGHRAGGSVGGGGVKMPDSMVSPFLEVSGLMFVQAEIDGRSGWFLLDSGSAGFLLNSKYFSNSPAAKGSFLSISAGIHGVEQPIGMMEIGLLSWQTLRATRVEGAIKNLADLEKPQNTPLLGAIGYEQLKDLAMVVDWGRRRVELYTTERSGARKIEDPVPPVTTIPFYYDLHLPVLEAHVGDRKRDFLFDSGASINLMPDAEGLAGHFRLLETKTSLSDGGEAKPIRAQIGVVDKIELGSMVLGDVPVMIYAIPYLEGRGLLGAPILTKGRVEINFRAHEMRFWR